MKKLVALFTLALLLSVAVIGVSVFDDMRKTTSEDPRVWDADIAALEQADRDNPPPRDAILFVGGSQVRLWHTLAEDMAPLITLRRGFGGARMHDLVYYADRLIIAYAPATVVLFAGDEDINVSDRPSDAAAVIRDGLQGLIKAVLEKRPDTALFYVAITPTITSAETWGAAQAANTAAESVCAAYAQCSFIATADIFLDEQGQPRKRLYQFDGLHLNAEGYRAWARRIKPFLEAPAPLPAFQVTP